MSQQSKGGQNFPNYLDVPLQSQQPDELDDIIDMLINAGLDLRGSPDFKEEADFIKGKAGYAKAYKQRLLSWRDKAVREARQDALTDAKDAIDKAGVPDPHGRKCWYAVDKLIPKHYRGATLQDNQPKEEV